MDGSGASGLGGTLARGRRGAYQVGQGGQREGKGSRVPVWDLSGVGHGPSRFPSAFLLFFILFPFSVFLISDLFHNFCIFVSKLFKQISKFI
jgi:hypothetical protein